MSAKDRMTVIVGRYGLSRCARVPFPLTACSGEECVHLLQALQRCGAQTTDDLMDMLTSALSCMRRKRVLLAYHRARFKLLLAAQEDSKDVRAYAVTTILAAIDYAMCEEEWFGIDVDVDADAGAGLSTAGVARPSSFPTTPSYDDVLVPFLKGSMLRHHMFGRLREEGSVRKCRECTGRVSDR